MSLSSNISAIAVPQERSQALDPSAFVMDPRTLTKWLGVFWTSVHQDPEFVAALSSARGLAIAQEALNLKELESTLDRRKVPVLHRERWYPVAVDESAVNTGNAATVRAGVAPIPVVGVQTDPSYAGITFSVGGNVEFSDINIYPLSSKIKTAKFATDSILDPSVILVNGADFIISDGCIAVRKVVDPFTGATGRWAGSPGEPDAVIWFCDAEFDTGFVQDYIGYPVGITAEESTAYLKHVINTFWDVLSSGPSYRLVQVLIGAVCGVPTVLGRTETVDTVTRLSDGSITVATDARVYKLGPGSNLRKSVVPGAVLEYGEFLDTAIKVYPSVTVDTLPRLVDVSELGSELIKDVPTVTVPASCFRARLSHDVSLSWPEIPVVFNGYDANGNPKLSFEIGATPEDSEAFWADVWAEAERVGTSLLSCLSGQLDDTLNADIGAVWGYVSPLEFFLSNLIGANTMIVSADLSTVPDKQSALSFFNFVKTVIPSHARLFFIERRPVTGDEVQLSDVADHIATYVVANCASAGINGKSNGTALSYLDTKTSVRWVPVCSMK